MKTNKARRADLQALGRRATEARQSKWLTDADPFLRDLAGQLLSRGTYLRVALDAFKELETVHVDYPDFISRLIEAKLPPEDVDAYVAELVTSENPLFRQYLAAHLEDNSWLTKESRSQLLTSLLKHMLEAIARKPLERQDKRPAFDLHQKLLTDDIRQIFISQLANYDSRQYPDPAMRGLLLEQLPLMTGFLKEADRAERVIRIQLLMQAEDAETRLEALRRHGRPKYHGEDSIMAAVFERSLYDREASVRLEARIICLEHYLESLMDPANGHEIKPEKEKDLFEWLKALPDGEKVAIYKGLAASRRPEIRIFLAGKAYYLGQDKELWETALQLLNDEYGEVKEALTANLPDDIPSGRLRTALLREIAAHSDDRGLKVELLKKIHLLEPWLALEIFTTLAEDEDRGLREEVERQLHRFGSEADRKTVEEALATGRDRSQ